MIIWSGMGFLVVLLGIAGLIAGGFLGSAIGHPGAGLGIGGFIAAAANWGLCKVIYPKQPQVLVNPSTGQQVLIKPSHSLFFIPMPVWTWLMAAGGALLLVVGFSADGNLRKETSTPGYKEFTAANDMLSSNKKGIHHGNTAKADAAATAFGETIKPVCAEAFSGGSKRTLLTGGDFLTHCQDAPDRIVFLCHVPELRNYKSDEAKKGLGEIAWACATKSAAALDPEHRKTLVVALRGITNYGMILSGPSGAEQAASVEFNDRSKATSVLPAFAPAGTPPPSPATR